MPFVGSVWLRALCSFAALYAARATASSTVSCSSSFSSSARHSRCHSVGTAGVPTGCRGEEGELLYDVIGVSGVGWGVFDPWGDRVGLGVG